MEEGPNIRGIAIEGNPEMGTFHVTSAETGEADGVVEVRGRVDEDVVPRGLMFIVYDGNDGAGDPLSLVSAGQDDDVDDVVDFQGRREDVDLY